MAADDAFDPRARSWVEAQLGGTRSRFEPLAGGAGARRYWRCTPEVGPSVVLMHALPEEQQILPPALREERAERSAIPFVEVSRFLAERGFPVPRILAVERGERWVLLEDLGDMRLCDLEPAPLRERLLEAVGLLARVHAVTPCGALPFRRHFDAEWIRFELGTFAEHGLDAAQRSRVGPALDALVKAVAALPRVLSLRDFQSQNLMIDPGGSLRILDYQDALLAPRELDLAALLWDSYIDVGDPLRDELLARYEARGGVRPGPDSLALLVVQRKCKDFGRYRYLVAVVGDTRFASALERARGAVRAALPALPNALGGLASALEEALGAGAPDEAAAR